MTELEDNIPEEDASNNEAPPPGMNLAFNLEMRIREAATKSRVLRGRKCFCEYISRHQQPESSYGRSTC